MFCVWDRSSAASTSSRMYSGAGLKSNIERMRERATRDLQGDSYHVKLNKVCAVQRRENRENEGKKGIEWKGRKNRKTNTQNKVSRKGWKTKNEGKGTEGKTQQNNNKKQIGAKKRKGKKKERLVDHTPSQTTLRFEDLRKNNLINTSESDPRSYKVTYK